MLDLSAFGSIPDLIQTYGLLVVFFMVMVESMGVPVPGETVLVTASIYAGATHHLAIWEVVPVAAAGAIVGAVMKATKGQADAKRVRELVIERCS
ncbi:MAG TPA: hypothetical protein VFJ18_09915 [Pararhizobium sp.]|nr:hypothetical protein [Pararhizobium sp.]